MIGGYGSGANSEERAAMVGRFYRPWISAGEFLPATGSHDNAEGIAGFDDFSTQPHGQRYYEAGRSAVTLFVLHHAPYSSSSAHGSSRAFQWPFGAGAQSLYGFARPLPQSRVLYSANFGALFLTPTDSGLRGMFRTVQGTVIDRFTVPG